MWDIHLGDAALRGSATVRQIVPAEILLNLDSNDNQLYLDTLSRIALDPRLSDFIFINFEPIFPDLVSRWTSFATPLEFAAAISGVLPVAPYLVPFAEHFLLGPGLRSFQSAASSPPQTNLILTSHIDRLPVEVVQQGLLAVVRLLKFDFQSFSQLIRLEDVWPLLQHASNAVRFLGLQIIIITLKVADSAAEELLLKYCGSGAILGVLDGSELDFRFFWYVLDVSNLFTVFC